MNNVIKRSLFGEIIECLEDGKIALLFGTRRVGKTTLLNEVINYYNARGAKSLLINCDTIRGQKSLDTTNDQELANLIKDVDILAVDEAQNVESIGKTLKIIHDVFPKVKAIATGSSSFDLANKTGEPLVGRMHQFLLYPFSAEELRQATNAFEVNYNVENFLKYGMYPCIYGKSALKIQQELESLVSGYLYKDLLAFDGIRNSNQILKLLQCLALQIGSEVSFNELSNKLQISANTVKKYIDLLEKCFVIFSLPALSRNIRNEIAGNRTRKIYFYDIGVRNALIEDFRGMDLRNDIGGVWENFCIAELRKKAQRENRFPKFYFWRTTDQKEIDLLEEENGEFSAYEFKYSPRKEAKLPANFNKHYQVKNFSVINSENWHKYF
ncbi:MAG: AAA family ATPase [Alphaproteobacteria bacterium]|nr:AAA family ATPase [Alphaproteobacteria bacterium]